MEDFKTYLKNGIALYQTDCIAGMKKYLQPNSVDLIVTSPPYNLGINYADYNDSCSRKDYLEWTDEWAVEVERVLADEGSFFLNVGSKPKDPTVAFELLNIMLKHFKLQNTIHWVKSIAINKAEVGNYPGIISDVVVGHFKPINSKRFINDCHEYIFHFTKNGNVNIDRIAVGVPYQDKTNVKRWKNSKSGLHCRGNTWFVPYETINNRNKERPHPASFPIELPLRCAKLHGIDKINVMLDPFLGIGSSGIAAVKLNLNFIGFEISKEYFDFACDRIVPEVENLFSA